MAGRNLGKALKAPGVNQLSSRAWLCCGLVLGTLCGCAPSGPAALTVDEQALVRTYVRISVLDVWRGDEPDSARIALDRLAAQPDTAAVRRALEHLQQTPERWEAVWDAIAKQLHDLETQPSAAVALRTLDGKPPGEPAPKLREPALEPVVPRVVKPQLPARPRVAPIDSLSAGARAKHP